MTGPAPGGTSAAQDAGNSADGGVGAGPARKTIGSVASDAIREGLTNEQALERVLAEFPYARTTKHTIGKYRRMLRNGGEPVPTAAQARAEAAHRQPSMSSPPPRPRGDSSDPRRPAPPPERETVGSVAMNAIRDRKTNRQVVEIVKAQFPEARISESSVNSYRSRLRRRGEAVPTAREATEASTGGFGLLVAELEAARAARDEMATKADLSALEARLVRRLAGLVVAAGIAAVAAVTLLS